MQEQSFESAIDALVEKNPQFTRDAYLFLREALDHTQKVVAKENKGRSRHVTPTELLDGIRQFALAQFGPMTMTVLADWGVTRCEDFGTVVFNMIEAGLLSKTDKDQPEDFKGGFEFDDAFRKPFLPPSRLPAAAPEPARKPAA